MIDSHKFNHGDKIFLFSEFPYDYSEFPLQIIEGVDLISPPVEHELYPPTSYEQPYRYALPLLNIPSMGTPNACIRISASIRDQDQLFWQIILALRMIKPLEIGLSGTFTYDATPYNHCGNVSLYNRNTTLNTIDKKHSTSYSDRSYTSDDIRKAKQILKKIRSIKRQKSKFRRLVVSLDSFATITCGESASYPLLFQEAFTTLESLFGSPANGNELGRRVEDFLKGTGLQAKYHGTWIKKNYEIKRNKIAHGNPAFWMNFKKISGNSRQRFIYKVGIKKYNEILRLHEIIRLCLLGFLGHDYKTLLPHNEKNDKKVANFLKTIKASPLFLKNQKLRLNHPYKKQRVKHNTKKQTP